MNITRIYLITNCHGDPNKVYIGKTGTKTRSRLYNHRNKFGKDIIFTYIDEVEGYNKKDWAPLEKFWIEYFRQLGFDLQNKNKGGGGPEFLTDIQKKSIGLKMKGKNSKKVHKYSLSGMYINSYSSIREANNDLGVNLFSSGISSCCSGIIKYSHGFIWKFIKINKGEKVHTLINQKVYQFNLDNECLREWNNIYEASDQTGIYPSNIIKCLYKKIKTAGKFLWSLDKNNEINLINNNSKKLNQYDLDKKFIKEWPNSRVASLSLTNDIKSNTMITKACRGELKSSLGFIWEYKN
jgi:hypothetical protein